MTDDRYATAIAAWEDDGGQTSAGATEGETLRTNWLRSDPPATVYLPTFGQCSALWSLGRQPRGD